MSDVMDDEKAIRKHLRPLLDKSGVRPVCEREDVPRASLYKWLNGERSIYLRHFLSVLSGLGLEIRIVRRRRK